MSQSLTFDRAVRRLYFDVNVFKVSGSLVGTFSNLDYLKHNDTVVRQWNLNTSILMNSKENAWSSRHVFSFTKSPIPELKIQSGQIVVIIGETSKIKKLIGVDWQIDFENKSDGEVFYNKLNEMFAPVSTKQKIEYDKDVGHIAQYSTRTESEKGIRDVSFCFGKSLQTNKYQITLSLFNEFAAE